MFYKKWIDKFIPKFLKRGYNVNILHNRFILYFILFLSIINILSYGLIGNYLVPIYFISIGIITSCFSKNMTVILTVSLLCSNIMKSVKLYEGMEDQETEKEKEKGEKAKEKHEEKENKKEEENENVQPYDKKNETKVQTEKIEGMQQHYKELMTLQDKILGNIGTLEESLSSAEGLVKKIGMSIENK